MADLSVHFVRFRGLSRILTLLGCGVGAATLRRDVQTIAPDPPVTLPLWVEVDEELPIGEKHPVAVILGPTGERLDLHLRGPASTGTAGSRSWKNAVCWG